jgi:rSAM/selenodomain-associated transferase 2
MRISVIIPVLNEEQTIASTLNAIKELEPDEVIVVDGGSQDRTREILGSLGIPLITAPRGRGRQMNAGAQFATGEVLLFLHADTRLPESALADIRRALAKPDVIGGRFDLKLDGAGWVLKVVGYLISLRSRLTKVATGDQAIFVRRDVFDSLKGFPEIPLMEDVAFARTLKHKGAVACLRSRVLTSARRWEKGGIWRTIFRMWALRALYLLGVSPYRLKRYYSDAR